MREVSERFGFKEIATPTFELTELFTARSGESIIEEMYTFEDKGGRRISLRPELTAPVIRFYVDSLQNRPKPLKVYYFGNCFRYENPQSGRFREFWQFGVELISSALKDRINERIDDLCIEPTAEVIAVAYTIMNELGLKNYVLRIGNIDFLRSLFEDFANITGESKKTCMRLVDKANFDGLKELMEELKVEKNKINLIIELVSKKIPVPKSCDLQTLDKFCSNIKEEITKKTMTKLSKRMSAELILLLGTVKNFMLYYKPKCSVYIDFGISRGLDYYTGIVFELDAPKLGAEKQICGGGEYELGEVVGGEKMYSSGFAIGFDRTLLALEKEGCKFPERKLKAFIIPMATKKESFELLNKLRENGISTDIDLMRRNLSKNLKYADAIGAEYALILGPDEIKKNVVKVKSLRAKIETQEEMSVERVVALLRG